MEAEKYTIQVHDTDTYFTCKEDESIFEAMKRARCGPIYSGCFGGGCGKCKMKILSGSYSVVKRMSRRHVSEEEQKENIVLLCCVQPRSNVVIARLKTI